MSTTVGKPEVRAALDELRRRAREKGLNVMVTSGDRSRAEQERLYAQRASNSNPVARPGTSGHEHGTAVDLNVFRMPTGERVSPGEVADLARESGLHWYGDADPVHFTFKGGRAAAPVVPTATESFIAQQIAPKRTGVTPATSATVGTPVQGLAAITPTDDEAEVARLIGGTPRPSGGVPVLPPVTAGAVGAFAAGSAPGAPVSARKAAGAPGVAQVPQATATAATSTEREVARQILATLPAAPKRAAVVPITPPPSHLPLHESGGSGGGHKDGGPYVRQVEDQLTELFAIGAGEIDPLTLQVRKPRDGGEKLRHFGAELVMPRMVKSDDQAAAAVAKLQGSGAIPRVHYSEKPDERKRQEARVRELARHLDGFDTFLDRRAANLLAKVPYNPPADGVADGVTSAPEGPNDPRYMARDKRMAEYRAGYLKQAAGIYDAGRAFWDRAHVGAYLQSKGVALGEFDKQVLNAVIPAKRAEWAFRLGKHQAFAGDGLQWLAEVPAGELQGVLAAPLVSLIGRKVATATKAAVAPLVKSAVTKAGELTQGGPGRVLRELSYLGQTAKTYMGTLGPSGKQLGGDLQRVSMLADRSAGQTGKASQAHLTTAAQEVWGEELEKLEPLLDQIARQKSPAEAKRVARFILSDVLGDAEHAASAPGSKLFKGLTKYQTVTKLGLRPFTALRNATQRLTNSGLEHGVGPVLKAQGELLTPWRKASWLMKQAMTDAGVFAGETGGRETIGNKAANATLALFDRAEKGNRYIAARVRQIGMEQDLDLLLKLEKENPAVTRLRQVLTLGDRTEDAAMRRLDRAGLNAETVKDVLAKGGRLEPEQYQEAMWRAVQDQQFAQSLASSPMWWQSSPALRALTQFKSFGAKQTNFVWEHVIKEAAKGNAAPLARYLAFTQVAGEMYHAARDVGTGSRTSVAGYAAGQAKREERPEVAQIAKRMWSNFAAGGGLGLLTDLVMTPGGDAEWDAVAGAVTAGEPGARKKVGEAVQTFTGKQLPNYLGGPTAGTGRNVAAAAGKVQKTPTAAEKAVVELILKEAPALRDFRGFQGQGKRALKRLQDEEE